MPFALSKWLPSGDPGFDALAEETTQETLVRVMDKIDTFRGQSKITTWVYKIAVHIALSELRCHRWRDVSFSHHFKPSAQPDSFKRELSVDLIGKIALMLENTAENELSCEQVFELIDQYVDLDIQGEDAAELMPLLKMHLEICGGCHDEYEALVRIFDRSNDVKISHNS